MVKKITRISNSKPVLYSASHPSALTRWTCPGAWIVIQNKGSNSIPPLAITGLGRSGRQHVLMLQRSPGALGMAGEVGHGELASQRKTIRLDRVVHTCNPNIWEVEAEKNQEFRTSLGSMVSCRAPWAIGDVSEQSTVSEVVKRPVFCTGIIAQAWKESISSSFLLLCLWVCMEEVSHCQTMRQMWDNRLFFCLILTHSKIGSSESALSASLSLPL